MGVQPVNAVPAGVPVYNPSGCALTPTPTPTKQGVTINPADLVGKVCGYVGIEVDNTASSATTVRFNQGLKDLDNGAKALIEALYGIPTTPEIWASENTAILFGTSKTGPVFPGNVFVPFLNNIYETTPYLYGTITFQRQGGTDAAFSTFKRAAIQVYSMNPAGNWSNTNYDLKPEMCSPCFNNGDDVVQWNSGGLPAGSLEGLSMIIPIGLKGQFEQCVIGTAVQRLFEPCA